MTRHVVIIGAGIVGAVSAIEALHAGLRVTLVEAGPVGGEQAASYGNAGWLASHSVIAPAEPGIWKKVPGFVLDPLGPLAIRMRYLPQATPWLIRYLASGWTEARVEKTAHALRALLLDAPALHHALASAAGVPQLIERCGLLHAYPSRSDFEADGLAWTVRHKTGVRWQELQADALHALEPALHPRYQFGVWVGESGHCRDPGAYVSALVAHACAQGATLICAQATGFRFESGRLRAVRAAGADIGCDAAVIAAGAHARSLAALAGDLLPLETERGYHVVVDAPQMLPERPQRPRLPVMVADCKAGATPMERGLRIAGQVEIAGLKAAPNWRRAEILRDHLLRIFPGLPAPLPAAGLHYWMGHRPSMPDGRPCIGYARASRDVVHAFGHGHIGLVGAARTGRLVAQLLADRTPEIALAPFDPRRFARPFAT